ncbi:44489_t:CDS:2, partial [Gigaspora margarita]
VSANSRLPITTVFENISNSVNSPVLQNFNIVYDQIYTIECSDYDSKQTILNNLNEPLRHLKYISNENKSTRYAVGSEFKPEKDNGHLREPCAIILKSIQSFRWIDYNVNNAQVIRDLEEEIRDLKRKLNKNNPDKPKPIPPIPT